MAQNENIRYPLTMSIKILIPLHENDVAPRFDLATEVLIATGAEKAGSWKKRMMVLPRASADQLCHLVITEGIRIVICGGIEDTYYQYLIWKKIEVIDSVIGSTESALKRFIEGTLKTGDIL
ncbi:NifB/NifX family molybdenum-iron cluster-binding protein [Thermodesulfobacteriota bacterium]